MAMISTRIACGQCNGKGKKTYAGRKVPQTCTCCAGDGKVTTWSVVKDKK